MPTHLPMLAWLAAAAAPILIHLWSRRKYRETAWAAMQFLLQAVQKQRRRLFLEQWLLLLLRTLIIVLVVLAVFFALQPRGTPAAGGDQRTHRLLVLDASYSMAYRPGPQSRFEQAKQIAAQIIAQSPAGDAFSLIAMATPPRIVVGAPAFERREVLDELDRLELSPSAVDLPAALACVERVLQNAGHGQPRAARQEVYFLTDLGRVGWSPASPGAAGDEIRRRAGQIAQTAAITLIDLGQPNAENCAVTGLQVVQPVAIAGQPVQLEARLRNFGRHDQPQRTVELWVNGRRVDRRRVDLPAGAETGVRLHYTFDAAGEHAIEARLQADRLELDDRRYLAVPVRRAIRVLCVDGGLAGRPASEFLRVALAPQEAQGATLPVQPDVVPESGLLERDLTPYDALFLCDIAQFTASETRVLADYVRRGGSLIFFLGERVLPDRYNAQLAASSQDALRLLPARLGKLVSTPEFRLDPLGYRHTIVQVFRDRQRSGLLTTPVAKHYRLETIAGSRAQTVVALQSGDPLMIEEPLGNGRVVLVGTSADMSWTDLPRWPSFVPLVQETLAYCLAGAIRQRNQLVGHALEGELPPAAGGTPSIVLPGGRKEPLQTRSSGDRVVWSYAETNAAGIYMVRLGHGADAGTMFAANLDTSESDLTQLPPEELQNTVWAGVPFTYQTSWQPSDRAAAAGPGRQGPLPVRLLFAALGLLLTEGFCAWRFGHPQR